VKPGADLANQDVARVDALAAEFLDAAALRVAVAPVAAGALSLLMSHRSNSLLPAGFTKGEVQRL
jgi:hypothetical protein